MLCLSHHVLGAVCCQLLCMGSPLTRCDTLNMTLLLNFASDQAACFPLCDQSLSRVVYPSLGVLCHAHPQLPRKTCAFNFRTHRSDILLASAETWQTCTALSPQNSMRTRDCKPGDHGSTPLVNLPVPVPVASPRRPTAACMLRDRGCGFRCLATRAFTRLHRST